LKSQIIINVKTIPMKYLLEYYISKAIKKLHLRAILNCQIHKTSKVCAGSHLVNVKMDKYSDVGYDCTIIDTKIGAFCSLGANINIGGASHSVNWVSTSPVFNENKDHIKKKFAHHKYDFSRQTAIGNDVWIGDRTLIKAGVTVGDGAVIGMGSVVTKDIPPYQIWAGNPAKMIKNRFSEDIINDLLKVKWWEFDDDTIEDMAESFCDAVMFVNRFRK
jgi:acetyltransferase-like isoleucine patch superfamily enzyme